MNIDKTIDESIAAIASLRELKPQIESAVALLTEALRNGGKILACGNGGSAADGAHFTTEYVFARQIEGLGKKEDVLVAITSSGNSPNVKRALEAARECGMKSVALLGRDGGSTKGIADIDLTVPGAATARIQEAHKVVIHLLCAGVEEQLFPELY
jgi:D-sedoheptulose 7-phosphate isomerase